MLSKSDSFLEDDDEGEVSGIVGGCYCCSQNIHVTFNHLEASPVALVDDSYFYIIVCDQCEEDIMVLKEEGIEKVSYDVLWLIQENLATELYNIISKDGEIDSDVRDGLLVKLYKEAEKKVENKSAAKYLSRFAFDADKDKDK